MDEPRPLPADPDIVELAEALAARIPLLRNGETKLELHFKDGKYRRGDLHLHALRPDDLRELTRL